MIPGLERSPGEGNGRQPTPVFLQGEFHGQTMGLQRVRHSSATFIAPAFTVFDNMFYNFLFCVSLKYLSWIDDFTIFAFKLPTIFKHGFALLLLLYICLYQLDFFFFLVIFMLLIVTFSFLLRSRPFNTSCKASLVVLNSF